MDRHGNASLAKALDYSRNKHLDFLNFLYEKSIIDYRVTYDENIKASRIAGIILNPTLARRTKFIHQDSVKPFKDLRNIKM